MNVDPHADSTEGEHKGDPRPVAAQSVEGTGIVVITMERGIRLEAYRRHPVILYSEEVPGK